MSDNNDEEPRIFTSDLMLKVLAGIAIVGSIYVFCRMRPRTTFAADGLSPIWDATVEQSRLAHTPTLVLFTADWCPACNALHADALSQPRVQEEIANHYQMITVDLTSPSSVSAARSRRYGVGGIPTLIRFDADGKETSRSHYLSEEQMMTFLHEGEQQ